MGPSSIASLKKRTILDLPTQNLQIKRAQSYMSSVARKGLKELALHILRNWFVALLDILNHDSMAGRAKVLCWAPQITIGKS